MREETIKIYQFEELPEEAQETAIEDERNSDGYLMDNCGRSFLKKIFWSS